MMATVSGNTQNSTKLKEYQNSHDLKLDTESLHDNCDTNPITPDSITEGNKIDVDLNLNLNLDASDSTIIAEDTTDQSDLILNLDLKENNADGHKDSNINVAKKNLSSPPQIPNKGTGTSSSQNAKLISKIVPAPIGVRGRVVSLDRRGYLPPGGEGEEDDDDDDGLSSSQNSSDDGSYFSEHHLSPKGDKGGFMLPPKRTHFGNLPNNRRGSGLGQPVPYQRSRSFNYGGQYQSKTQTHTHDSDLSLSSSSNDESTVNPTNTNANLENAYPLIKTNSAPEPLRPRPDPHRNLDLGPVDRDNSVINTNRMKPPIPTREPLQVISSSDAGQSRSDGVNRFSSGSSFVSSSSEDVGNLSEVASAASAMGASSLKEHSGKHRRQHSYRSVESSGSSLPGIPDLKNVRNNVWRSDEVESELSDADSYVVRDRRRKNQRSTRHERQQSISSADSRIPLEIPSPGAIRSQISSPISQAQHKDERTLHHSGLSDDQLNAWRSGTSEYFSSTSSVVRNNSSTSLHSSGLLVYSEDDTDESARRRDGFGTSLAQGRNGGREPVAAGVGPTSRRAGRSFGQDLTNSNTKMELPSKPQPMDAEISSGRSADIHSSSNVSRGSTMHVSIRRGDEPHYSPSDKYIVYWQRWLMLMYMSILNLLSDWTCYSIAPIAVLTTQAYGNINPEHLVTIFLASNALATSMEPIILSRLGLRKTVVFGSFLLMCGSVIKSGGIPGIIGTALTADDAQWRIYLGFLLVGLSQPLYQCTPTLLSCSWFPEKERTFATGVALNSNQLGIGCAFVFGTMQVLSSDDIPQYFGLMSILSTLAFIGCFLQFQDAPPTPPSETARVMRGTLEVKIPYMETMRQAIPSSFRAAPFSRNDRGRGHRSTLSGGSGESHPSNADKSGRSSKGGRRKARTSERRGSPNAAFKSQSRPSSKMIRRSSRDGKPRRSSRSSETRSATADSGLGSMKIKKSKSRNDSSIAPSPSNGVESTENCRTLIKDIEHETNNYGAVAPSPMMNGRVGPSGPSRRREREVYHDTTPRRDEAPRFQQYNHSHQPGSNGYPPNYGPQDQSANGLYHTGQTPAGRSDGNYGFPPDTPFANLRYYPTPIHNNFPMQHQPAPYIYETQDPTHSYYHQNQIHQNAPPHGMYPSEFVHYQQQYMYQPMPMFVPPTAAPQYAYSVASSQLPATSVIDDGAEPVLSQAGNNLAIEIRDDQVFRSIKACFSRPGFTHTVVAFAASGIVLNTLSTYMDYLVRLGGSGREMVGIIGGSFQILVMISSIFVGKFTDKTRAYFPVVIGLLVLGAFALAECGINLDAERGNALQWSLLLTALLIGPLQPISTELAVDVSFPLCSNTVLVIQQLVSNLCSALFIPLFQRLNNFGKEVDGFERPQYTFSFYMLIVIHALATVFFATFNGKYMRLEHEQRNKGDRRGSDKVRCGSGSNSRDRERDNYGAIYDDEKAALV